MNWLAAMATGLGLGLLYFGGLWLTVRRVVQGSHRTPLLATSHVVRFAMLGSALSVLSQGGAGNLLAALVGIWLARSYLVCRLGGFHHGR